MVRDNLPHTKGHNHIFTRLDASKDYTLGAEALVTFWSIPQGRKFDSSPTVQDIIYSVDLDLHGHIYFQTEDNFSSHTIVEFPIFSLSFHFLKN